MEPRVDVLFNRFPFNRLHSCLHSLIANTNGVLCNSTSHNTTADSIHQLLARVKADDYDLTIHLQFIYCISHTYSRAFIRAIDSFQIRICLHHRFRKVCGL
ncbi:hypothetical protein D3C76_1592340 [compost metagenome]